MRKVICYVILTAIMMPMVVCENKANLGTSSQEELYAFAPEYRIWLTRDSNSTNLSWRYEVGYEDNIIFSASNDWNEPHMFCLQNGIVRLELGGGSNDLEVRFFDLHNERISPMFNMMSNYANYTEDDTLVAFPKYLPESNKTVVVVRSIFDDTAYLEIDEGFMTVLGGINNILFLRRNELYIDYDVFLNEQFEDLRVNKRTVVTFDSTGYSVVTFNL